MEEVEKYRRGLFRKRLMIGNALNVPFDMLYFPRRDRLLKKLADVNAEISKLDKECSD